MIVLTPAGHSCPIPCSCNACPVICPLVTSSTCPWRAGAGGKRHRTTTCGRDSFGAISRSPQALAYGQVSAHCRHFLGWPSSGSATIYLIAKSEQMATNGFLMYSINCTSRCQIVEGRVRAIDLQNTNGQDWWAKGACPSSVARQLLAQWQIIRDLLQGRICNCK